MNAISSRPFHRQKRGLRGGTKQPTVTITRIAPEPKGDRALRLSGAARNDATLIILRDIPLIAEIERWIWQVPGITWRPEFERRADEVSIALFGLTRNDARPPEPHPDQFRGKAGDTWFQFSDASLTAYDVALRSWYEWEAKFVDLDDPDLTEAEIDDLWADLRIDVRDEAGEVLRCLEFFDRQLIAAVEELGTARFTSDESGRRGQQDASSWGDALEAEAARFKRTA